MGFIRGLLTNLGGLEDDENPPAPTFTQNPVQAPQMGVLSPNIPTPTGFNPSAPPPTDPSHAHRGGLLGRASHWLGADRIDPEVAALLTPAQQKQVRPKGLLDAVGGYLLTGKSAQERSLDRAGKVLQLQDTKVARDTTERQRRQWEQIQGVAQNIPDPQARLEFTARMASSLGLPQGEAGAIAADRLRPPMMQARANKVVRDVVENGKRWIVTYDPDGNEISREEQYTAPRPTQYKPVQKPDGTVEYVAVSGAGAPNPRETGLQVPDGPDARARQSAQEKRANDLRVSQDDLAGVDDAIDALDQNPNAFGLKNKLPAVARQRLPGAAEDAVTIGSLEYVVGRLRHDRFGGALTSLEADKAARIFSEPSSPPDVIRAQLTVIRRAVARQRNSLRTQMESGAPPSGAAPRARTKTVTINGKTFEIPE